MNQAEKVPERMISESPNHELNITDIRLLSTLVNMIDSQRWSQLEGAIISNPATFQLFLRKISRSTQLNGMTM
jgi:hypothetical protein